MISSLYSRILPLWILLLSAFFLPTESLFSQDIYKALLTGRNEVMPTLTPATGLITATLNGNELVVTGEFERLSSPIMEDGMNIQIGFAGQEGAITLGLIPSMDADDAGGTLEASLNTFSLGQAQLDQLTDRQLYINVATTAFPNGEIRGQLLPDALTYFSTNLFGSNEVPAVNSFANGHIVVELVSPGELVVTGSFSNLESNYDGSIGAHLHVGVAGVNGAVVFPLNPTINEDERGGVFRAEDNTIQIELNQLLALGERRIYANIHSVDQPGGELRGQLVPAEASAVFRTRLSGSHAVPVQLSKAVGVGMAEIYGDTLMIVSGSFDQLDSPIATVGNRPGLYSGLAAEEGGLMFPLNVTPIVSGLKGEIEAGNNVFLLAANQTAQLYRRGIYINLASEQQTQSALRGQFVPEAQVYREGFLSGTLAVPPSPSCGYGNIVVEINENQIKLSGSFQDIDGSAGQPALRLGYAGSTGERLFPLVTNGNLLEAESNTFELSEDQMEALINREVYLNLPSSAQSSGELRAQILPEATAYFVATLSGASQTDFVDTEAYGQVIVEYTQDLVTATGSFSGLDSDFNLNIAGGSHIYDGFAGSAGEIVERLNVVLSDDNRSGIFEAADNTFILEGENAAALFNRGQYVDILSTDETNGAIRGQLLPYANAYFTTTLSGFNEILPVSTEAYGGVKAELHGKELVISGSFNELAANADANGASLRIGDAGTKGSRIFPLQTTIGDDPRTGIFLPENNRFELTDMQIRALKRDRQYVKIISPAYPQGELRGQLLAEPNFAPEGETVVTLPQDGEDLIIEGDPTAVFRLSWTPPTDESKLYYVLQTSDFEDFREFENKGVIAGFENTRLFTVAAIDSILAGEGLAVGENLQTYYRLVASDGALSEVGKPNFITLTRGETQQSTGADLELFIKAPETPYEIFTNVPYEIILINRGPQNARNIFVRAPLPAGMVFTSANATAGTYNLFFNWWNVPSLAVGDTAILNLTLFTLVEDVPISNFVEIIGAQPLDPDSTPNNGVSPTPMEDDEAEFTIFSEPVIRGGAEADLSLTIETVEDEFTAFSNTTYILTLTNDGPDSAANMRVSALIPEGMTFTSADATHGRYRIVTQDWEVPFLRSGESAVLELTLFSLVEGRAITLFSQVIASDQDDPDSTPANDLDGVPDEDDEASATILPDGGLEGGVGADLAINISINRQDYEIFTDYVYTFTLTNSGPDAAANIFIDAQLPDSLAFTAKSASVGDWNNFFQYWYVPFIESGQTQTLRLTLFTLSEETPITYFAQIIASEQEDPDSTPNNNTDGIPVEDDEATLTISPTDNGLNELESRGNVFGSIYPVPTTDEININVNATKDKAAFLSVIDFNGAVVRKRPVDLTVGDNLFQFDVRQLPAGMYYVLLTDTKSKLLTWKFVKVE